MENRNASNQSTGGQENLSHTIYTKYTSIAQNPGGCNQPPLSKYFSHISPQIKMEWIAEERNRLNTCITYLSENHFIENYAYLNKALGTRKQELIKMLEYFSYMTNYYYRSLNRGIWFPSLSQLMKIF